MLSTQYWSLWILPAILSLHMISFSDCLPLRIKRSGTADLVVAHLSVDMTKNNEHVEVTENSEEATHNIWFDSKDKRSMTPASSAQQSDDAASLPVLKGARGKQLRKLYRLLWLIQHDVDPKEHKEFSVHQIRHHRKGSKRRTHPKKQLF